MFVHVHKCFAAGQVFLETRSHVFISRIRHVKMWFRDVPWGFLISPSRYLYEEGMYYFDSVKIVRAPNPATLP